MYYYCYLIRSVATDDAKVIFFACIENKKGTKLLSFLFYFG